MPLLPAGPGRECLSSQPAAMSATRAHRPARLRAVQGRPCRRPPGSAAPAAAHSSRVDQPASGPCRGCRRRAQRDLRSSTPGRARSGVMSLRLARRCLPRRPASAPHRRDAGRPGQRNTRSRSRPGRDGDRARSRGPRSSGPVPARLRRASRHERRPPEPTPRGCPPFPFWPPPTSGSAGHPADRVGLPGPETRRSGLPNRQDPCPHRGGGRPWLQFRHDRLRMRATTATGRSMCGRNTGYSITSCHV
ncbi:hypothetical protein ACVWZD_005975 [Streptomyces sp. TE3672]